ncbi:aromatic-ring-hydroxylating dioxygenase subunit beta [Ramlibacter albus]|uniref:Nuclear transport factor 2 family protein n=1 Tax=Ramlibacter albus TaxID=2079448 RepID=A0A923M5M8_9BURK|nr:aromatic-ring-hydroxylating dioxygenase subunit beta [Ramlibacter albus]MBC5763022.1 nuclear transport factor 2 family protein [Ramlibacter albus]
MTASFDEAAVHRFLFKEARLQDEHRYEEWEALWAEEAHYWVPLGEEGEPESRISIINDNRARIAGRVRQLMTGRRHAQSPASRMRRVIGNIEVGSFDGDTVRVESNFLLIEHRRDTTRQWAGRTLHVLRPVDSDFRMLVKKVSLVDVEAPIPTLAFLI